MYLDKHEEAVHCSYEVCHVKLVFIYLKNTLTFSHYQYIVGYKTDLPKAQTLMQLKLFHTSLTAWER